MSNLITEVSIEKISTQFVSLKLNFKKTPLMFARQFVNVSMYFWMLYQNPPINTPGQNPPKSYDQAETIPNTDLRLTCITRLTGTTRLTGEWCH